MLYSWCYYLLSVYLAATAVLLSLQLVNSVPTPSDPQAIDETNVIDETDKFLNRLFNVSFDKDGNLVEQCTCKQISECPDVLRISNICGLGSLTCCISGNLRIKELPTCQCMYKEACDYQKQGVGQLIPRAPQENYCDTSHYCCPFFNDDPETTTEVAKEELPTDNNMTCGRWNIPVDNRISATAGSSQTSFGEFPWMVLLLINESESSSDASDFNSICGGSIITERVVLTAAHCVSNVNKSVLTVRAGEYDTAKLNEDFPHQDRKVKAIKMHENYIRSVLHYDFALLLLTQPFQFGLHIAPICLSRPSQRYDYDNKKCIATGWGKGSITDEKFQSVLKKVYLSTVERNECEKKLRTTKLGKHFSLHKSFLCAIGENGDDTCKGDGGGPLVCLIKNDDQRLNTYVQVGIVSWGINCAQNEMPAVYSDVQSESQWILAEANVLQIFNGE